MAYFSKFPILQYPVRDGNEFKFAFVANLLRRVGLSEELKGTDGAFIEYNIKDGERPEHIAERVYGDPSFHWLVMMTNDIVDPYHGWYKSGSAMEQYVQTKHGGKSVFIGTTGDGYFYSQYIGTGSSLSQGSISSDVIDYTPTLCRLTVRGGEFQEGTATVTVSGATAYEVQIFRVDPSITAVHHFEFQHSSGICGANDEFTVDPLSQQNSSFSLVGGVIGHTADEYPPTTEGITYQSTAGTVDFWETYIGRYMGVSGDKVETFAVSNLSYENTVNDQKRTIKILHPRYKREALAQLEALLRV